MEASQELHHFLPEHNDGGDLLWGPGKTVGIIGGMGQMGQLFRRFFRTEGYTVLVADRSSDGDNKEVLRSSDIVLFAVPLHETVDIIRDLIPYIRPDQLVMDLSSLKIQPIHAMLDSPAAVVGLHPMFGGSISSFMGQTMVACPVRIAPLEWSHLRRLFENQGIRIKECTPEKHDYMMSIIQVLFHVTTMLTGRVLREMGVDVSETMEYTSPSYRLEMNLLGRIFAQNASLYSAITQMNPYTQVVLAHLEEGMKRYKEWYAAADFPAFVSDFIKSSEHLGDFCNLAFEESSMLLDFAVRLADAGKEPEDPREERAGD